MRFLFGTSERGSLDKAMDALQQEVDAAGITEGLDRQQVRRQGSAAASACCQRAAASHHWVVGRHE